MRVATSMRGVHFLLHAPQGDTYADLLFTMIERRSRRPPVTYTTFAARDLGSDTASLFESAAREAAARFQPDLLLVGASCTAELIQDDPGGIAAACGLPMPIVPLELSAYQRRENWGASHAFARIVRACCPAQRPARPAGTRLRCNLLGPTALGFRHRDDVVELRGLLARLGADVHVVAPEGASPGDLARLGEADFNVLMYPEIAQTATRWLEKAYGQPTIDAPIGVVATRAFCQKVAELTGVDPSDVLADDRCRAPWYSRSVDSTYLTDKAVYVFGEASRAIAMARVARDELGFRVVGLGTYAREFAREIRAAASEYGIEALVSDDHLEVEERIAAAAPELVLGTQMERHIAKRLGLPCAVISAPAHVQDFPARYSPQMGFEGANVLFDTLVHPLMMGLEEHLLGMFRDDFEFSGDRAPSHLAAHSAARDPADDASREAVSAPVAMAEGHDGAATASVAAEPQWTDEAERELKKIPFFVRGKARRNTERFAREFGRTAITLETLYDAKAYFQA
jgi:light-independent protochlorophyllide reductase subunit B